MPNQCDAQKVFAERQNSGIWPTPTEAARATQGAGLPKPPVKMMLEAVEEPEGQVVATEMEKLAGETFDNMCYSGNSVEFQNTNSAEIMPGYMPSLAEDESDAAVVTESDGEQSKTANDVLSNKECLMETSHGSVWNLPNQLKLEIRAMAV